MGPRLPHNLLASPFRLYDSRNNGDAAINGTAPLGTGTGNSLSLQVSGTAPKGGTVAQGVPTGATGVIGTVTVTNTGAAGGYLQLYPGGGSVPGTSTVNWTAAGQTVAASFTSGLSTAGKLAVTNGGVGGSSPTDVIVDIIGYIF